jgi:hypothetical protein
LGFDEVVLDEVKNSSRAPGVDIGVSVKFRRRADGKEFGPKFLKVRNALFEGLDAVFGIARELVAFFDGHVESCNDYLSQPNKRRK